MGVKAYFINGFEGENRFNKLDKVHKRDTLTRIPDIIKYQETLIEEFFIYKNILNSYQVITAFGEFETVEQAYGAYAQPSKLYNQKYKETLDFINKHIMTLEDTEWCAIFCVDEDAEPYINHNQYVFNSFSKEDLYFRSFIDTNFIYHACTGITIFLSELTSVKELSKFQQYQISMYSQQIQKVKKPELFLTNEKEINIFKKSYESYQLTNQIDDVIGLLDISISNYSFLWEYKNNQHQRITNLLLTLFTIIVSYSSLKDVIAEVNEIFIKPMDYIIVGVIVLILLKVVKIQWVNMTQNIHFRKRT